jgi:hypothetical protein
MLTLRLDQSDLAKLKSIANAQGIGVTTMARKLLHERLQGASNQRARQTRRSEPVGGNIAETLEDAKASSEDTDLGFLVLSIDRLNQIDDIVSQHAFRLFVDGLKEQAVSITPSQVELFDKIKDLQPAD